MINLTKKFYLQKKKRLLHYLRLHFRTILHKRIYMKKYLILTFLLHASSLACMNDNTKPYSITQNPNNSFTIRVRLQNNNPVPMDIATEETEITEKTIPQKTLEKHWESTLSEKNILLPNQKDKTLLLASYLYKVKQFQMKQL